ncbi:MAG TPA: response regulator transcription factor [Chitinophagales bacterium]|nr:response regulator transcription factor [Chitinophagales bacterium]
MEKIRITIADSHFLSRKGLAVVLNENADFILLAEALSTSDLVNQAKFYSPDLIIIDYASSSFTLEGLQQIVKKYPQAKLLAITEPLPASKISQALNSGVTSHLLKDCDQDEIVEAIYKTVKGEKFMCGKIVTDILQNTDGASTSSCAGLNISEREMEIIKLVAEGFSNKEVADKLFLSTHTITTHRKNIMNKLGVNNTAGLVLFAVRENLISPNHFLFASN